MGGSREYLQEISQRALDLGLEGLMIESHCDPSCALSDARQQLTPPELKAMLESLVVRDSDTDNDAYRSGIEALRSRIDVLDENLLSTLASRLEVSRKIGAYKREHNIAIIQASRWDSILEKMIAEGEKAGLSREFVTAVFTAIHEESVRVQK